MKSHGQLWERITSAENLLAAWGRVRKGHAGSQAVQAFGAALDANLAALRADLLAGEYRPGEYVQFRVHDPKPRTISCAPVRDRVLHHALCGVITPLLERGFTEDSYACREGKGTHRACARARDLVRAHPWFCKIDVRHYFDSIGHDRLLEVLLPKFREREVRGLIERIVRHPVPGQAGGRGLPIGNLTSQWFANAFLDGFDHQAKETMRLPGYIRYMDDMVMFAESKPECWLALEEAERWLRDERGLQLKTEATRLAPVTEGLPFLGLRIFPACWRLQRERFLRTRRRFAGRERAYTAGLLDGERLRACAAAADGGVRWFGFKNILKEGERATGDGAASGSNRVKRGGSWNNNARNCRSANRNNNWPDNRNNNIGFRAASTVPGQAGSHPGSPASRADGNEQVRPRAAGSAGERRAGSGFWGDVDRIE
ncbi:MAG: RNA-dependent DNA polymerase [Lentisphaerae bacterium]|nr:RNA-dependent DNA polymerase [Lentisphaerota bacterium]